MVIKSTVLFLFAIFFSGCFNLFEVEDKTLKIYSINDSTSIEVHSVMAGATTPDDIQIWKEINRGEKVLIKTIVGFDDTYKVDIEKIDDSLVKMKLSDTSIFKGSFREFIIDVNYVDTIIQH
jgi:hypothetical protein